MNIGEAIILGLFQGITEFLPISSSGHLALAEHFLGLEAEKMLVFDSLLHGGTLLSVLILFWRDVWEMLLSLFIRDKQKDRKFLLILIVATLPAAVIGYTLEANFESFRSVTAIAIAFLFTAVIFLFAEQFPKIKKSEVTWKTGLIAGFFQALALFPGVSRSGSTMAGSLLAGTERGEATRFAFFLSIPITTGVVTLYVGRLVSSGDFSAFPKILPAALAFFTATISGYFTARFLLSFFRKYSLRPFAMYLLVIGIFLLGWEYFSNSI